MRIRYFLATAALCLMGNAATAQEYCREYTDGVVIGGVRQSGYGTACYMPDGSWQITQSGGYQQAGYYQQQPTVIQTTNYVPVPQPSYYYQRPYSSFNLLINTGYPHYRSYYKPRHHYKHHGGHRGYGIGYNHGGGRGHGGRGHGRH